MTVRKILIATPTFDGWVHARHMTGVIRATWHGATLLDCHLWAGDMVRMRNRCIRMACDSDSTHLMFWDADVSMSEALYQVLTMSMHPVSAALYFNARGKYNYHGDITYDHEWSRLRRVPAGALVLDLEMLRAVGRSIKSYVDVMPDDSRVMTPNFCENRTDADDTRLSEDYSLCDTLAEAGFYPHAYNRETACHWKTVPLHKQA